jgi:hypothetical protein
MRPPPTIPTFTVRIIPNLAGQGYSPHPASRKIDGPEKEKPLPTGRSEGLGRRLLLPAVASRRVFDVRFWILFAESRTKIFHSRPSS